MKYYAKSKNGLDPTLMSGLLGFLGGLDKAFAWSFQLEKGKKPPKDLSCYRNLGPCALCSTKMNAPFLSIGLTRRSSS